MAALALTVTEARNRILKMINAQTSTAYQTIVLDQLNSALTEVCAEHPWEFLRGYTTVATTDATGVIDLPDDLDKILSIHADGADYILAKLTPIQYEQAREDSSITVPVGYVVKQMEQDTSDEIPHMEIQVVAAPGSGTTYRLWYIKHCDELLEADVADIPSIPPHIWDLVVAKGTYNVMLAVGKEQAIIRMAAATYERKLITCKQREDTGHVKSLTFGDTGFVNSYYKGRH